eukprot:m51a1_g3848 hypothetical protein (1703) ;mRNA; f:374783-380401
MNLLTLLQGDLRSLSVEARKKFPAIKEAADRALAKLKSEEVLRPVMMVLEAATQQPHMRGGALGVAAAMAVGGGALGAVSRLLSAAVPCLQKLLSNNAVAPAQLPAVVRQLAAVSEHCRDSSGAAVDDLNVKVLQALTTLVSCNASLHGLAVAEALGISFRLHARGGPAVRRTASAALPMIVTMLFDRAEVELGIKTAPSRPASSSSPPVASSAAAAAAATATASADAAVAAAVSPPTAQEEVKPQAESKPDVSPSLVAQDPAPADSPEEDSPLPPQTAPQQQPKEEQSAQEAEATEQPKEPQAPAPAQDSAQDQAPPHPHAQEQATAQPQPPAQEQVQEQQAQEAPAPTQQQPKSETASEQQQQPQEQQKQPGEDMGPACKDAAAILQDLCALTGGERAEFLPLGSLAPTFGLELVELIISSHVQLFRSSQAFARILSERVCPLLIKNFQNTDEFAMGMRTMRVAAAFAAHFTSEFTADAEVLLMRLVRMLDPETAAPWQHAAVLEILRMQFSDGKLLMLLFERFDSAPDSQQTTEVIRDMLLAITKLLNSLVPTVDWLTMSISDNLVNAPNRSRCMEHLSQAEAPVIKNSYRVGMALGCLLAVATSTHDLTRTIPQTDPRWGALGRLASTTWTPLLSGFSSVLAPLREETVILSLFKAYEATIFTLGTHGIGNGRDAFLESLCKFTEPVSHVTSQAEFQALPLKSVEAVKTLLGIAHCMGGILDSGWGHVLDALEAVHKAIISYGSPGIVTQQSEMGIAATALTSLFNSTRHLDTASTRTMMQELARLSEKGLNSDDYSSGGPGNFCLEKLIETAMLNVDRIDKLWEPLSEHIAVAARHKSLSIRNYVIASFTELALSALTGGTGVARPDEGEDEPVAPAPPSAPGAQRRAGCAPELASTRSELVNMQVKFIELLTSLVRSSFGDTRVKALEALYKITHAAGQVFVCAWPHVIKLLSDVGHQAVYNSQGTGTAPQAIERTASPPVSASVSADKQMTVIAFQTVHLICTDFLPLLPRGKYDLEDPDSADASDVTEDCLSTYITLVGKFGRQTEHVNISLTSGEILWNVAYHIGKRVEQEGTQTNGLTNLWVQAFTELRDLAADERFDVRNGSLVTLFKTLTTHGKLFDQPTWDISLWTILFPLLDTIKACASSASEKPQTQGKEAASQPQIMHHHSRDNVRKQWNQSVVMAMEGAARLFKLNIDGISRLPRFAEAWGRLANYIRVCQTLGSSEINECSVRSLHMLLGKAAEEKLSRDLWDQALLAFVEVVGCVAREPGRTSSVLTVAVNAVQDLIKPPLKYVQPGDVLHLVNSIQPLALLQFEDYVDENGLTTLQSLVLRAIESSTTRSDPDTPVDDRVIERALLIYADYIADGAVRARDQKPSPTDSERRIAAHVSVAIASANAAVRLFSSKVTDDNSPRVREVAAPALLRALTECASSRRVNPASPLWDASYAALASIAKPALADPRRGLAAPASAQLWLTATECASQILCPEVLTQQNVAGQTMIATRDDEELEVRLQDALAGALLDAAAQAQGDPTAEKAGEVAAAKLVSVIARAAAVASHDKHDLCEALYRSMFGLCNVEHAPEATVHATSGIVVEHAASVMRRFMLAPEQHQGVQGHARLVVEVLCVLRECLALRTRLPETDPLCSRGSRAHLLRLWPLLCKLIGAAEEEVRSAVGNILAAVGTEFLSLDPSQSQ